MEAHPSNQASSNLSAPLTPHSLPSLPPNATPASYPTPARTTRGKQSKHAASQPIPLLRHPLILPRLG
eukprot:2420971-Rhodomonas_salina.1